MRKKLFIGIVIFYLFIDSCFSQSSKIDFDFLDDKISSYVDNYQEAITSSKESSIPSSYSPEGGIIFEDYDSRNKILVLDAYLFFETGKINYKNYFIDEGINYFVKTTMKYDKPIYYPDSKIISSIPEFELYINDKVYVKDSIDGDYKLFNDKTNMNVLKELLELIM